MADLAPQPRLGRIHAPDPRDRAYLMRYRLDPLRAQFFPQGLPAGQRHYRQGAVLDQGETGTCVAHGWAGWAFGAPTMTKPKDFPTPFNLYREIVLNDEFPDNDYESQLPDADLQLGTTVRGGAKTLQKQGRIAQYLWAESVEDVRAWHLAGFGGVVLGINWTEPMFNIDKYGFLHYTGRVAGGHCVKTTGWSDHVRSVDGYVPAVRIQNSWGTTWGQKGRAWITATDLARLLADEGECCAAVEVPKPLV